MELSETLRKNLQAFIEQALNPLIATLEAEANQKVRLTVGVVDGNSLIHSEPHQTNGNAPTTASGAVRVCFEGPGRFKAQAIVSGIAANAGFSGFLLRGRISSVDGATRVRITGKTFTYNLMEWEKELRAGEH